MEEMLAALKAADAWIDILVDEMDIDPATTTITVNAVGPDGKRELANRNLADALVQIREAIAKADPKSTT